MQRMTQGMLVSMKVGSVSPEFIIGDLGLERHADGDVAVGAVDRAEDGPDLVLVGHA